MNHHFHFPLPPAKHVVALLLAGMLALTACAGPEPAGQPRRTGTTTMSKVTDHPPMPGESLPDPARTEMESTALERMQSGAVLSRKM